MKPDPLAPYINQDGRAFNGNWTPVGLAFVASAIGILVAVTGALA